MSRTPDLQARQVETIKQDYGTGTHQTHQNALGRKKAAIGMTGHEIHRPDMA